MPTRHPVDSRHFANHQALMGPMLIFSNGDATGMIAYEHGSEAPDAFLEFVLTPDQGAILRAVKGAYEHGQTVDSAQAWQSPWLQIGAVSGGEDALAETYRTWALKWQCPYAESRKPYIFYRSRAIPDRDSESSEARTLAEIEVARRIGIDVFVLDDHWYEKFGAWQVSARRFPHGLAPIKSRLDEYGMKLGLGLAPPFAALSPDAATGSVDAFADTLIRLHREVGATYFRWAGIEQYSSGTPAETQGTPENAIEERRTCHAFLQSRSLTRIVDRLAAVCPDAIVDLDIAAPERCMGLEFLSAGKYSVGSDDARHRDPKAPEAHATRAAARRIAVEYDRWLPGTLFQTHFLLDDLPGTTDPRANQDLAIASLALGPSGVGGDLLALSDEGVEHLGTALNAYKRVRHDITETSPIREGVPGGSPEIHEKLHPVSGRGLVSLFAARPGTYRYITHRRVAESAVHNDGIRIRRASDGRAIIEATFLPNQWAKWIFFGAA